MSTRAELVLVYWLTTVLSNWNNIVECKAVGEAYDSSGVEYLKQFGYIDVSSGHAQAAQDITHSLKAFQKFAGLKVTGKFDQETVEKMKAPRCGDKDPLQYKSRRRRRYVLEGSVWKKKDLTYRIVNDPYSGPTTRHVMTPELISKTLKAGLQKWSYVADLTFTEVNEGEADIMILFAAGYHGDQFKFDGPGKALAHAFYPGQNTGYDGDVHFDLAEKFSLTEEDSTNFIWVTTHEFGHSLGLRHSPDVEAIMYPWYTTGEMGDVKLSKDDKNGIRKMYGKSKGRKKEARIVLPVPPRKECKYSFEALFHDKHNKKVFAFRESEFYVLNENGEESKGPRRIVKRWEGLDMRVRAAYTRNDGYTIFFTRHRYFKYRGTKLIEGPEFIEEYGLSADLRDMDAVVSFPGNGETYFFKEDKYWKYDEKQRALVKGYPKPIKTFWPGLPDNLDAALQSPHGDTYFFKGQHYYKFDHYNFRVPPGYPAPIGPYWLGCTDKEYEKDVTLSTDNASLRLQSSYIVSFVIALLLTILR